jgi:hypothetical protein
MYMPLLTELWVKEEHLSYKHPAPSGLLLPGL